MNRTSTLPTFVFSHMHRSPSCLTSRLRQRSSSRACSPGNGKTSFWHHSLTSFVIVRIECFVLAALEKTIWNDSWKVRHRRFLFIWHSSVSNTLVLPKPVSKIPTRRLINHLSTLLFLPQVSFPSTDNKKFRSCGLPEASSFTADYFDILERRMVVASRSPSSWAKCQLLYRLYTSASCLTVISSRFDYLNRFEVILMWDRHSTLSAILARCLSHHGVHFHRRIMKNSAINTWITLVPFESI